MKSKKQAIKSINAFNRLLGVVRDWRETERPGNGEMIRFNVFLNSPVFRGSWWSWSSAIRRGAKGSKDQNEK
jgi:hypothetical protein